MKRPVLRLLSVWDRHQGLVPAQSLSLQLPCACSCLRVLNLRIQLLLQCLEKGVLMHMQNFNDEAGQSRIASATCSWTAPCLGS